MNLEKGKERGALLLIITRNGIAKMACVIIIPVAFSSFQALPAHR
jgi:hypothetical protein